MKIAMYTTMAGPDGIRLAGRVYEVDSKTAKELIAGGFARAADKNAEPEPMIESASIESPSRQARTRRAPAKKTGDK